MSVASAQDDRSAEWNRLLMKAESISDRFDTNITFKESSVNTLNWNKPEDASTPESIGDEIRVTLPKVQDVFSIEFVLRPSFPILMLKRVADFYGCLIIPEDIVRLLDDESLRSREAMLYAWLGYLMNPSLDGVTRMLDLYWTVQYPTGANSLQETPVSRPAAAPASILVQSPTRHNNNTNVIDVTTNTAMMPHGSTPTHQPRTSSGPTESVAHRRNERAQTITQVQDGSGTTSFSIEDVNPPTVQRNNNLGDVRAHFQSGNDSHKKASSVSAYFRESHFTGSKEQSIHRTIRDFNVCARQYELSTDQKRIFFVNAFAGSARDYFFDNCRDDMSFDELVKVMVNDFDSDARQLAVHSELDRITIERVMADNDITEMDTGLTMLVEKINTLTPQCPQHFRSDTNKTRFLRNAVIRQEWARPAISQITTSRYNFLRPGYRPARTITTM